MNSKDDNNSYYVELPSSVGECSSITSTSHDNTTLKNEKCRKEIKETNYDRLQSFNYFRENESHEFPAGPSYLIGLSLFESKYVYKYLSQNDVDLHLIVAKFVTSLSTNQRKDFAKIMDLSLNSPSPNDVMNKYCHTRLRTLTLKRSHRGSY